MKRLKFKTFKLEKEELKLLKGGIGIYGSFDAYNNDVKNSNTIEYCICTYNNNSLISNLNSIDNCSCVCESV
jgi:hypothetical protein